MGAVRVAWDGWKARAHDIGDFQSRVLLTAFYFTVLMPFGLVTRLSSDPLRVRRTKPATAWSERPAADVTIKDAGRQF